MTLIAPVGVAVLLLAIEAPPDPRAIETALARPRLDHCDELACYYRPARHFAVRALTCAPAAEARAFDCAYDRAEASLLVPIVVERRTAPPPAEWSPARSRVMRVGDGWIILSDSDD